MTVVVEHVVFLIEKISNQCQCVPFPGKLPQLEVVMAHCREIVRGMKSIQSSA
jgi:hypothetical protein